MPITNFRSRRAWGAVGAVALGAVVLSGAWWGFVSANDIVNAGFLPVTPSVFVENISRWQTIWNLTASSLLGPGFSYIWPQAAVGEVLVFTGHPTSAPQQCFP